MCCDWRILALNRAVGMPPRLASRVFIFGSARAALISLLSLSMTSADVFFVAPMPQSLARHVFTQPRHLADASFIACGSTRTAALPGVQRATNEGCIHPFRWGSRLRQSKAAEAR